MKNEEIPVNQSYKYLGHLLSVDLRDELDISRQRNKVYAQGNMLMLIRKFGMCTDTVKKTLFKAYCTPLYTAHLWWNFSKAAITKLYVAYNNITRILFHEPKWCSASQMFVSRGLPTCQVIIRKSVYSFMRRIENTCNAFIQQIAVKSQTRFCSSIWKHWMRLLFVNNEVFMCKIRPPLSHVNKLVISVSSSS